MLWYDDCVLNLKHKIKFIDLAKKKYYRNVIQSSGEKTYDREELYKKEPNICHNFVQSYINPIKIH